MKISKILALVLALVMVLGLFAGCNGGNETPEAPANPDAPAPTDPPAPPVADPEAEVAWDRSKDDEIIVSVIAGYYTAGEKKLAEEYMKLYPETKVVIDVIASNDDYNVKMQSVVSNKEGEGMSDIVHANFLAGMAGGPAAALQNGLLFDMNTILDMEHPYQDGTVRDMYDPIVLQEAVNGSGGAGMQALPFDKCGISFFYNKTAFEAQGLKAPETWEELLETCAKFEAAGVDNPITVSSEASWILTSLADAGFRANGYEYMVQPGDAMWDETTMSANKDFVWDESNLACDTFTVESTERQLIAKKNDIIHSDISKTAWTEFAKLAKYFPDNYIEGGVDAVTDFETQMSPILVSGSWNVGLILDDLNQMPEDARFDWATFNVPGFANAPAGFGSEMRGLYTLGNVMGIVPKGDADHQARVLDFYLYWYSQAGAQLCYEETLSNGNYVQGPAMIKGVVLSDALNEKLAGFIVEGPVKQYAMGLIGMSQTTEADRAQHNKLINDLVAGNIDIDTFLDGMAKIMDAHTDYTIEQGGYDLDPTT